MKSPAVRDHRKSDGRSFPLLGLTAVLIAVLILPLVTGCPGMLPEAASKYGDAGGAVTGTGGMGGAGTGGTTVAGCDAPTMVFKAGGLNCALSGCHGGAVLTAPDLSLGDPWVSLMGKNASSATASACLGMPYVVAGNPPTGVLMQRVTGESCGAGTRMPIGSTLTQDQITCLASWLTSKL